MKYAKEMKQIDNYCWGEFGSGGDFRDLRDIGIAYTTFEPCEIWDKDDDGNEFEFPEYDIQVCANIPDRLLVTYIDDIPVKIERNIDFTKDYDWWLGGFEQAVSVDMKMFKEYQRKVREGRKSKCHST